MTNPDAPSSIAERLQAARRAAGLTQAQAAERAGVGRSRIAEWESGLHTPGSENLQRLASAYGVTTDSLHGVPGTDPDNALHLPSYWKGRMEGAAAAVAAIRGLANSLERDVQGILGSPILNTSAMHIPPEGISRTRDSLTPEELARGLDLTPPGKAADTTKPRRRKANGA